jgi:AcrR family transcriptional regulator
VVVNSDDVLDAMQDLILEHGQPPSIQTIAKALGRSKQAVLHYFPDRVALETALAQRAVTRVDQAMTAAAARGDAAATYLRLALPTTEDRAVALLVLASLRTKETLPVGVDAAIQRWEGLIAAELGSPVAAEAVRLVGDGLFMQSLVGEPPPSHRVEALIAHLLGHDGSTVQRR